MFGMKPTEATPGGRVVRVGIIGSLKVAGSSKPKTTRSIEELCNAPEVELVLIVNNHALHASAAVLALQANKYVFIENPIALTLQDTDRIIAADKAAGGAKIFIGYMRRYAAALIDQRDIIGPNSVFVGQSGTYPRTFNDYPEADSEALYTKTHNDMEQALHTELGITVTKDTAMIAMREIIGMPKDVCNFQYPNFAVAYESGVDQGARFDASIEIFGDTKTVKVCIDSPFIEGLPTIMVLKEVSPDGSYRESTTRRTCKDPFMLDTNGQDLEILGMLMKATTA
ncbi:hypothetical protein BDV24DRAFT_147768 [Aspergillus arachidicola]|uniref:Gfo/Idh/MocA-like oxidoreductase N-terminal domain-containing protein n=1 Tax=Aspergillus arachidicola TaxID=656916 RepID=A0A5N6YMJ7_9EURO|nr:hypothetical protein BDV24DRAFT_147768 [Aspergillus arachidicola]